MYRAAAGGSAEKLGQAGQQSGRGHRTLNGRSPRANMRAMTWLERFSDWRLAQSGEEPSRAAFSGRMRRFRRDPSAAPHDTDSRPGAWIRESADHDASLACAKEAM
jgi:hypothetical protein